MKRKHVVQLTEEERKTCRRPCASSSAGASGSVRRGPAEGGRGPAAPDVRIAHHNYSTEYTRSSWCRRTIFADCRAAV